MSNKKQTVILLATMALLGMSPLVIATGTVGGAAQSGGSSQAGYLTDCAAVQPSIQTGINQPVIGTPPQQDPCTFINLTDSLISQTQYQPPPPTNIPLTSQIHATTVTGIGAAAGGGTTSSGGSGENQPKTNVLSLPGGVMQ